MEKRSARQRESGDTDTEDETRSSETAEDTSESDGTERAPGPARNAYRSTAARTATGSGNASEQSRDSDGQRRGYVTHSPGPDRRRLSERYGIPVQRRETNRLDGLEAAFGSEQVSRWAEEGIPVEAMGKPRDMQAFRESESDDSGASPTASARTDGVVVQPKLAVSSPDDPAEKEAEEVAERVVQMDSSSAESSHSPEQADRGQRDVGLVRTVPVPRAATRPGDGSTAGGNESAVRRAVRGGGKPLPPGPKSEFESKMGADFSDVSVHTGSAADEAARFIDAKAYTLGSDLAFAKGNYNPESSEGKRLLAHELTHVVQQRGRDGGTATRTASADTAQRQASATESGGTSSRPRTYTVKEGDYLIKIARKFGIEPALERWREISELNRNNPNGMDIPAESPELIWPGQTLTLPQSDGGKKQSGKTQSGSKSGSTSSGGKQSSAQNGQQSGGGGGTNPDKRTQKVLEQAESEAEKQGLLKIIDSIHKALDLGVKASKIVLVCRFFRRAGFNWGRVGKTVLEIVEDSGYAKAVFDRVASSGSKFASSLSKLGDKLKTAGIVLAAVKVGKKLINGKIGPAFGELYKALMGLSGQVAITATVDAIASLATTLFGDVPLIGHVATIVKEINPLNLGGFGVDACVTVGVWLLENARNIVTGSGVDLRRLAKLVQRMKKKGGMSYVVAFLEKLKVYGVLSAGIDTIITLGNEALRGDLGIEDLEYLMESYDQYGLDFLTETGEWWGDTIYEWTH